MAAVRTKSSMNLCGGEEVCDDVEDEIKRRSSRTAGRGIQKYPSIQCLYKGYGDDCCNHLTNLKTGLTEPVGEPLVRTHAT